jgi:hypothetical protein
VGYDLSTSFNAQPMMKTTTFFSIAKVCAWHFLALLLIAAPVILKAQAPAWQWATPVNVYAGPNAPAPNGDIYASGAMNLYADFSPLLRVSNSSGMYDTNTGFIARLNGSTRQWLWVRSFAGRVYQITDTNDGGVTVLGEFHATTSFGTIALQSTTNHSLFVAHCSSAGQWLWAAAAPLTGTFPNTDYTGYTALATDITHDGDIAVAGIFTGTATFGALPALLAPNASAYFAARLNGQTGQWQWAMQAPISNGTRASSVNDALLAPNGSVLFTGALSGTASFGSLPAVVSSGSSNLVVACANGPAQQWQWATQATHPGIGKGTALAITRAGNVVVTGQVNGPVSFGTLPGLPGTGGAMVVAGLAGVTGQWQWANQTGGPFAYPYALALTSTDDVVVAGEVYDDTLRIGNLPREALLGTSCFVAKLAAQGGTWRWRAVAKPVIRVSGGFSLNFASGRFLSLTTAGEPLISGAISNLIDFGNFLVSPVSVPTGIPDYTSGSFVAKLAATPLATISPSLSAQTQIFPNPASHSFTLRLPAASATVVTATLLNSLGQVVRRQAAPAHTQEFIVDVHDLSPGLYTLLLPLSTETVSRRVQVK